MTSPMSPSSDSERQTFGQWLKGCREGLGMTLREVEAATEGVVSNALISQIETGKIERPSLIVAIHLAAVYGLPAEEVFERARTGNRMPPAPVICETCGQLIRSQP